MDTQKERKKETVETREGEKKDKVCRASEKDGVIGRSMTT